MSIGTSKTQTTSSQQQNQNSQYANAGSNTTTPVEDPLFTAFRQQLLPAITQQYQKAQTPVYGAPQKAQILNQANTQFNDSAKNVAQQAASRGALDSGLFGSALTNLAAQKAGNVSNFFSQIPMLNREYADNRTSSLLNLATSFLGRSPLGQTSTSSQSGNASSDSNATNNSTTQQSQNLLGTLFSSLMQGIGGGLGGLATGGMSALPGLFSGASGGNNGTQGSYLPMPSQAGLNPMGGPLGFGGWTTPVVGMP